MAAAPRLLKAPCPVSDRRLRRRGGGGTACGLGSRDLSVGRLHICDQMRHMRCLVLSSAPWFLFRSCANFNPGGLSTTPSSCGWCWRGFKSCIDCALCLRSTICSCRRRRRGVAVYCRLLAGSLHQRIRCMHAPMVCRQPPPSGPVAGSAQCLRQLRQMRRLHRSRSEPPPPGQRPACPPWHNTAGGAIPGETTLQRRKTTSQGGIWC